MACVCVCVCVCAQMMKQAKQNEKYFIKKVFKCFLLTLASAIKIKIKC